MTVILIIESDANAISLSKLFDHSNYKMLSTSELSEAWELLQNNDIDLIIVGNIKLVSAINSELYNKICCETLLKNIPLITLPTEEHLISKVFEIINILINTKESTFDQKQGNMTLIDMEQVKKITSQRVARLALTAQACSMREMVSILSHELSQPLMVVNTYVSGCIHRINNDHIEKAALIEAMKKVNEHVELAGKLIHRMKNSIRKVELVYEAIHLHDLIKRAVELVIPDPAYPSIEIKYQLSKHLPKIEIDVTKIKLVLVNLLNNAIEAMHEAKIANPTIVIETIKQDSKMISFSIKDNGFAISSSIIQNDLFNSCISTKKKGLGMGLATCRGIIDDHRGTIDYSPHGERGSCFKVNLPIKASH